MPGILAPAPRPAASLGRSTFRPRAPFNGGCIFAERPDIEAPDARIIWHADLDPGTIRVIAEPTDPNDPDAVEPRLLASWLTIVAGDFGGEHAVISDGWHHIRLDIEAGSLATGEPVMLHYRLQGVANARSRILPLRRFLHLCRHGGFSASLFPPEAGIHRGIELLQVRDALAAGASHREIADVLFGHVRVADEWHQPSESMRSRVRRLVTDARAMARGGYRTLLSEARRSPERP